MKPLFRSNWDVFFSLIIIMSFPLQCFYFFIIFFLVFFLFLFFCQNIFLFTPNECFSHFNVQQLLSNISHFVLFSQAHLKIILKTKTFEKIYFIRFYWISNIKVRFTLFKLFWSETWKHKIGSPNNSWGRIFFQKQ